MKIGQKAPDFSLKDKSGKIYSLSNFKGEFLVLFFYPKDDTPGCTIEAQRFTEDKVKFAKLKVDVVGISGGDEKSKEKFCRKHKLDVLLLSDPIFAVARSYESYGEKTFMGRKYQGIFRNTFLIDKSKKVVRIFEKVSVEDHSAEILEAVKSCSVKSRVTVKAKPIKVTKQKVSKKILKKRSPTVLKKRASR